MAIPTYRRTTRLESLLALVGQQLAAVRSDGTVGDAAIMVIDNDDAGSARIVTQQSYSGIRPRYFLESTPGIPAVRNRALDEARDYRLLAFIDDDEIPESDWLNSLVATWSRYGHPTAVMGRVVAVFSESVDPWVNESGLYERPRMPTGTEIDIAATGNLLLDLQQVHRLGLRFDETIGLGGGSDTVFSLALRRAGGRIVWCDESVAVDFVEPARQTRRWALLRAYRQGNVEISVRRRVAARPIDRIKVAASGIIGGSLRIGAGMARLLLGTLSQSTRHRARGRRLMYRGAGMITGSFGFDYAAYRRS